MQPIRKLPTPTVNNQGKYRNLTNAKEAKPQPNDHTLRGTYICTRGSYVWTQGQTKPPRERSVTVTNTSRSVWQGEAATVGPPETKPGGSACHPEATEAAGMKLRPQTQAKATHAGLTITQAQRSEGNRGPECRSSRVPAQERSSRVPADPTVRRRGEEVVDPNGEVRGKATEARSQLFDDADRTGQDSQEIVQYQRAEAPGPILHR